MICACDHGKTYLIPIQSVQEWHIMPPQPSEKGLHCWKSCYSRVVLQETALPHETGACCLFIYHINVHFNIELINKIPLDDKKSELAVFSD